MSKAISRCAAAPRNSSFALARPPARQAGELPLAFVTLKPGAQATLSELQAHAVRTVPERAAVPVRIEILPALPLTAVGKIAKPALRLRAIDHVLNHALTEQGLT